jgi:hypothetical protein
VNFACWQRRLRAGKVNKQRQLQLEQQQQQQRAKEQDGTRTCFFCFLFVCVPGYVRTIMGKFLRFLSRLILSASICNKVGEKELRDGNTVALPQVK